MLSFVRSVVRLCVFCYSCFFLFLFFFFGWYVCFLSFCFVFSLASLKATQCFYFLVVEGTYDHLVTFPVMAALI